MLKVVLYIDETAKRPVDMGHATNLIKDGGQESLMIVVVANLNASGVCNEQSCLCERIKSLAQGDITLSGCRNSARFLGMNEKSLSSFVDVVTSCAKEEKEDWRGELIEFERTILGLQEETYYNYRCFRCGNEREVPGFVVDLVAAHHELPPGVMPELECVNCGGTLKWVN